MDADAAHLAQFLENDSFVLEDAPAPAPVRPAPTPAAATTQIYTTAPTSYRAPAPHAPVAMGMARPASAGASSAPASSLSRASAAHTGTVGMASAAASAWGSATRPRTSDGTVPVKPIQPLRAAPAAAGGSSSSRDYAPTAAWASHAVAAPGAPLAIEQPAAHTAAQRAASARYPALDVRAADTWQYPNAATGFSDREYQQEIVAMSLFHNTLVSLPTGLGKTFIAAVVMHNYFRWFPTGQIVFMAPTKPLVTQQIEACFRVVGIPTELTAQMQGNVKAADRAHTWNTRRVFYCTPQTFKNDLEAKRADAARIVLLVIDEAHRAIGAQAYVECINQLDAQGARYRILALSATPGSSMQAVGEVVRNLHISRVEMRTFDDASVLKYRHETTIDKIVVPLSKDINDLRTMFLELLKIPCELLIKHHVLARQAPARVTQTVLLKAHKEMQAARQSGKGYISALSEELYRYLCSHVGVMLGLTQALKALVTHGTLSFFNKLKRFQAGADTSRASKEAVSTELWQRIMQRLMQLDADSAHATHPKLVKLHDALCEHFRRKERAGIASRAIVFTQTRDSVYEVIKFLETCERTGSVPRVDTNQPRMSEYFKPTLAPPKSSGGLAAVMGASASAAPTAPGMPLLRPTAFVGQARSGGARLQKVEEDNEDAELGDDDDMDEDETGGFDYDIAPMQHAADVAMRGQTQKEQVATLDAFRRGQYNVLVATCIGEEGLDIGEVGICVMYDAVSSPIRMIQRLGRTGRRTAGEAVSLVSAAESERFEESFKSYKAIATTLRNNTAVLPLRTFDPVMVVTSPATRRRDVAIVDVDDAPDWYAAPPNTIAGCPFMLQTPIPHASAAMLIQRLISGAYTRAPGDRILPRMERFSPSGAEYHASQVAGITRTDVAAARPTAGARAASIAAAARPPTWSASPAPHTHDVKLGAWVETESQQGYVFSAHRPAHLCHSTAACETTSFRDTLAAVGIAANAVLPAIAYERHAPRHTAAARPERSRLLFRCNALLKAPTPAIAIKSTFDNGRTHLWRIADGYMRSITVEERIPDGTARVAAFDAAVKNASEARSAPAPDPRVSGAAAAVAASDAAASASRPSAAAGNDEETRKQLFIHGLQLLYQQRGVDTARDMTMNQTYEAIQSLTGLVVAKGDPFRAWCKHQAQIVAVDPITAEPAADEMSQHSTQTMVRSEGEGDVLNCDSALPRQYPRGQTVVARVVQMPADVVHIVDTPSDSVDGSSVYDTAHVSSRPTAPPVVTTGDSSQPVQRKRRRIVRVADASPAASPPDAGPGPLARKRHASSSPTRGERARGSTKRARQAHPPTNVAETEAQRMEARARYREDTAGMSLESHSEDDDDHVRAARTAAVPDSDADVDNDSANDQYDLEDSFINDASPSQDVHTTADGPARRAYHMHSMMFTQSDSAEKRSPMAALGKIRGRGQKSMPILSRLMQHIAQGDEFDDDDSEFGSSVDDKDSADATPSAAGSSVLGDDEPSPQRADDDDIPLSELSQRERKRRAAGRSGVRPPLHVGYHCVKCNQDPIRGARYVCLQCHAYDLCETCHRARGVMHTEELGFDRHKFRCVMVPEPSPATSLAAPAINAQAASTAARHWSAAVAVPAPAKVVSAAALPKRALSVVAAPASSSLQTTAGVISSESTATSAVGLPDEEKRARIERNRQMALARRAMMLQQQPQNNVPAASQPRSPLHAVVATSAQAANYADAARGLSISASFSPITDGVSAAKQAVASDLTGHASLSVSAFSSDSQPGASTSRAAPARAPVALPTVASAAVMLPPASGRAAASGSDARLRAPIPAPLVAPLEASRAVNVPLTAPHAQLPASAVSAQASSAVACAPAATTRLPPPRSREEALVRNLMVTIPDMLHEFATLAVAWLGHRNRDAWSELTPDELYRFGATQAVNPLALLPRERVLHLLQSCRARARG